MKTSESIQNLTKALIGFQKNMEPLTMDAEVEVQTGGGKFAFKYATLNNIIESTREPLAKCGMAIVQTVGEGGAVTTLLMHESGEWISDTVLIAPVKNSPQAIGSSITYAKRYSLASILRLVAETDEDGNLAEGNEVQMKELPKKEELPWMTEKLFNHAIEQLKNGNSIEVKEVGTLTRSQFKDWIWKTSRMKREYKEKLDLAYKVSEVKDGNNSVIQ